MGVEFRHLTLMIALSPVARGSGGMRRRGLWNLIPTITTRLGWPSFKGASLGVARHVTAIRHPRIPTERP